MSINSVNVEYDALVLGPVRVNFQRTLRIPESGIHDLPPGLGRFPLRRVEDYPDTVPAEWLARGGVMLPVYQREAMWLSFAADEPAALQVGIGKVSAVSGESWTEELSSSPQNYVPLPDQPWLDGINAGDGFIRQFVAVPLGSGATVEGQVTGREEHGGVQLRAVGLTAEALADWENRRYLIVDEEVAGTVCCSVPDMGLGAGGRMHQEIYGDDRELSDYDESRSWRVFVHLCSAAQWTAITGEVAPSTPVDRDTYVQHGLPWFDYYDADRDDIAPSETLAKVKTVGTLLGKHEQPFTPVDPGSVVTLKDSKGKTVAPGHW
ncbi:hypothetical protein [Aldersonia kunmingensis]|uniref:hypothetical protein n=1 Tax=Aldersonia kunmingensis TaxID=408066 RepID=UPI0008351C6F|nr:hypothetical protein [Aldersonia kunmingensis]